MDLIDRYIAAIRRNLPRDRAEDIAAELRDLLATRVEDREQALGRALDIDETKALLRDFGHPLIVAARYRGQQYLIGPDVFPFYLSVLRIVLTIVALLFVIIAAVNLLFNRQALPHALGGALGGIWVSLPVNFAVVTIVFIALERAGFPADYLRKWDPGQLADVGDPQPGPWKSAIEVAFSVAVLIWWSGLVGLPFSAGGPGFRMEAAPIFTTLYWPIFALIAARLMHNVVQWLRPRWRTLLLALAALTTVGGLALLAMLYQAGQWATIVSNGMDAKQALELQTSLNLAIRIAIVVTAIIWTLQFFQGLYRLSRNGLRPSTA